MKKPVLYLFTLLITVVCTNVQAQDTLPGFSLNNAGRGRIIVSWNNPFTDIRQLSIQRSADSLKGYKTIMTMADPTTPQNGYADTKAPDEKQFYRLYIMLEGGRYFFSSAKRAKTDSVILSRIQNESAGQKNIYRDSLLRLKAQFATGNFDNRNLNKITLIDSLLIVDSVTRAKPVVINIGNFLAGDTSTQLNPAVIKNRPTAFQPSLYVYTNKDGYVKVSLPEDPDKKYNIRFFDENNVQLFELKEIKQRNFRIDKANFFHAGWFHFEIYENGKLLEKHKFYLEKDF